MPKKIFKGEVICDSVDKTVNVLVKYKKIHTKYKKHINVNKKILAHDEQNIMKTGDTVLIQEHKRFSKRKAWVVVNKVEKK